MAASPEGPRIDRRQAVVAVLGLGYVGLPLATAFAKAGFPVVGIDVDASRVAAINRRESYIQDVPAAALGPLVTVGPAPAGRGGAGLAATTDYATLAACDTARPRTQKFILGDQSVIGLP